MRLTIIVAAFASVFAVVSGRSIRLAPIITPEHGEIIPDEYIVVLRQPEVAAFSDVDADAFLESHLTQVFGSEFAASNANDRLLQKFTNFLSYAAKLEESVLSRLRLMPEVDLIEKNQIMEANAIQNNAPWGLDRISQRNLPLSGTYTFPDTAGQGVDVYVIDTGVNIQHQDFEGRAVWGTTTVSDGDFDGNGHGTHVASTIGGRTYGVAKKATIIAVKVLSASGYGSTSSVIGGISFALNEHTRKSQGGRKAKSVANMSLGGGKSISLENAVERAIAGGVAFAVAAGNENQNSCNSSPAGAPSALTVGSVTRFDTRSSFSNFGSCVDLFAPGSDITAAWIGSTTAIRTISGTSMASPHAAGVLALVAASGDFTPYELNSKVIALATKGVVQNAGAGSPNLLLFNGFTDAANVQEEDSVSDKVLTLQL